MLKTREACKDYELMTRSYELAPLTLTTEVESVDDFGPKAVGHVREHDIVYMGSV